MFLDGLNASLKYRNEVNGRVKYGHAGIGSITINHDSKRILVKMMPLGERLFGFSGRGELKKSLCQGEQEWIRNSRIASHPKA